MKDMGLRGSMRNVARWTDRQVGVGAWLSGEPRPPRGGFDLEGEKLLDWGWICVNLPKGRMSGLEIGSGKSPIIPAMLALGYNVTAVDISSSVSSIFSDITFVAQDFLQAGFERRYDVIVLCSVVEHIGLSGRYNSEEDPDGDLKAMRRVLDLLSDKGLLFLTIPVGKDVVYRPWHRVYGEDRLWRLVRGFSILQSRFLLKKPLGPWSIVSESEALSFGPDIRTYGLGQFILSKEGNAGSGEST
jgi:SAM-dependent methyltransferase